MINSAEELDLLPLAPPPAPPPPPTPRELATVAMTIRLEFETGEVAYDEVVSAIVELDCPRVAAVLEVPPQPLLLPVIEAICLPVRACLLMMRLEAAASAVVGLSFPPPMPPALAPMMAEEGGEQGEGRVQAVEEEEDEEGG